jgi:membrane-bound lytic murein transglycosylase D
MRQLTLRISLTAAVASLTASFSSIASVNSDDAGAVELGSQHENGAAWSLPNSAYLPAGLPSISKPGLDVSMLMISLGGAARAEGAVPSHYGVIALGRRQACDLQLEAEAEGIRVEPQYTDLWKRMRAGFALPLIKSPRVARYEARYLKSPRNLQRVIERSRPYLYFIIGELERRGMPTEIALLPIIESAYNAQAVSPKRAAGLWQFMPATGRQYGLHQDSGYDGRRDVVAATRAALDYLQFLHGMFGDWELALAAYNWGEYAVRRAQASNAMRSRPTRYGSLKMPNETRNYLPQLQAVKNLVASSALLELPEFPNEPYFAVTKAPESIDVVKLARLADLPVEEFRSLNPGHRGPVIIQAAARNILLPVDRVNLFQANLERNEEPLLTWQAYTTRPGDTLKKIGRKFAITVRELREANGLISSQHIRPRQVMLVPIGKSKSAQDAADVYDMSQLLETTVEYAASRRAVPAKHVVSTAAKDKLSRARTATCRQHEVFDETRCHIGWVAGQARAVDEVRLGLTSVMPVSYGAHANSPARMP